LGSRAVTGPRKLWQLPSRLHCPVIGTCVDAAELRRIATRAGADVPPGLSDYDVHSSFVASSSERCVLSLALQKALEKRYAGAVGRFARARDAAELARLWQAALDDGDVAAGLWATLTHRRCNTDLEQAVYEQVHMLSHQVGAGQRAGLERLARAERERDMARQVLADERARLRRKLEARDRRIATLQAAHGQAEKQRRELALVLAQHAERAARPDADGAALSRCQQQLETARQRIATMHQQLATLRDALNESETQRRLLAEERSAMERLVAQVRGPCEACETEPCSPTCDLRGRRILCVGGRNRLIDQYREMVARCNGRFEHHDGGIEDNRQRLDAMLSAADAVVCATDAVSHDAYHRLKRLCKRHGKPHVFLQSSGVGTFARAIEGVLAT
jgi:hypothetical protein